MDMSLGGADQSRATVYVVDDDASVRRALKRLLESAGFSVVPFASGLDFLQAPRADGASCLVLDVNLPGLSGLELQSRLEDEACPPIVFITGYGDVPTSVKAMKAGAVDFISKPVREDELLAAIGEALERDRGRREEIQASTELRKRFDSLTPREKQVFTRVAEGALNKQVAFDLHVSEKTVKVHRARIMVKMQATSFADLVRVAQKLGLGPQAR